MDKKHRFLSSIQKCDAFIHKIASVHTNSSDDREDLVQEIIYQLWKSFDSFKQQSALSTWVYRVSLNVALYHLKVSKKKLPTGPITDQTLNVHDHTDDHHEEQWAALKQQLETLNVLDRGIVLLYLEDKSHDEIAAIVGISKSNVGTRLQRIKEKLKTQLTKNQSYGTE